MRNLNQMEFFPDQYIQQYTENGYMYELPKISDVTFLNGMSEPIHRWFRLTPSYSPELIRFFINEFNCNKDTIVLDPFLGKGTSIIELKKHRIPFVGIEINPILKLTSEYSLAWDVDIKLFKKSYDNLKKRIDEIISKYKKFSIEKVCDELDLDIPSIHDVYRWWKKNVLKELLLMKYIINKQKNKTYLKLYWIALCSAVIDCANIHRNHPTITFDDNHTRDINPSIEFDENINKIITDLSTVVNKKNTNGEIFLGDSTKISTIINKKIDRIITSPPYPNRFSYVHTTRPQLFFMDIFNHADQSAKLDCESIGGTWGKATSILAKDIIRPHKHIEYVLSKLEKELRSKSNLMCNYAIKYFNMMDDHIKELKKITTKGFKGAYVVGNSRLKGVEVLTEIILAKLFEIHKFKVDKIFVFRKRGGKKKLYETAVCVKL